MKKQLNKVSIIIALAVSLVLGFTGPMAAHAATSPNLGTAATFSILSGTSVTNDGITTISRDVGISPDGGAGYIDNGTATIEGTLYDADGGGVAAGAQEDMGIAYGALDVPACGNGTVNGSEGSVDGIDYGAFTHDLAGDTLEPGVYCADSFHLTNGTLTLDGNASNVWIFRSASDLIITGSASEVVFTNDGDDGLACNVWWRVVSTATLDAGSAFVGNILADTSITLADGASLDGRALASTAEVTLIGNTISGPTCTAPVPRSSGSRVIGNIAPRPTPTPTSIAFIPTPTPTPSVAPTLITSLPKTGIGSNLPNLPWQLPVFIIAGFALVVALIKRKQILSTK